jgi:hypothetical protein
VFWVKVEKYSQANDRALIRTLREDELTKAKSIDAVDGIWIEAELLYPLIRGRDLGRYCTATEHWHQIIPNDHYEDVKTEDEFAEHYPLAYSYFVNYRDLLVKRSTYKRYQKHLPFYVIYCVGSYSFRKWKVAWMEQQAPSEFRCAVLSDDANSPLPNKKVMPDHKLYFADVDTAQEAHFVCAYLNSHPVRTWLGGFLHGKQIGTSIFEFMYVPQFDPRNPDHERLAAISLKAHKERTETQNRELLCGGMEEELTDLVRRIATKKKSSGRLLK